MENERAIHVCYCPVGHEVQFERMRPSKCTTCSRPIISFDVFTLEEAEARRKNQEKAVSVAVETGLKSNEKDSRSGNEKDIQQPDEATDGSLLKDLKKPVIRTRPIAGSGMSPTRSPITPGTRQPVVPDKITQNSQRVRISPQIAEPVSPQVATIANVTKPQSVGLRLNYFGTFIEVPPEGGWLGREGIGSNLFEGNRFISRQHVQISFDQNGRLIIQNDRSLNGVYYGNEKQRKKLGRGQAAFLSAGEILWLYNLPLKVEAVDNAK